MTTQKSLRIGELFASYSQGRKKGHIQTDIPRFLEVNNQAHTF